jgi:hypothetical protein
LLAAAVEVGQDEVVAVAVLVDIAATCQGKTLVAEHQQSQH